MKTKLPLTLFLAALLLTGCVGPEVRHDTRVDRRSDRYENRYDRRSDRHERIENRYGY